MTPLCVLSKCDKRQRNCAGKGHCACTVTLRQIEQHEAAGYCPHPKGPKFGSAAKPAGWDMPAPYEIPEGFDPERERRRMKQGGCCGAPSEPGA